MVALIYCYGYALAMACHLRSLLCLLPRVSLAFPPCLTKCWQSTMPQSNDCCSLCPHPRPCSATPCYLKHSRAPFTIFPLPCCRHFWQFVQNQSSATNAMQQQEQLTRHNCHIRQRQRRRRRCRRRREAVAKIHPKEFCSITKTEP